MSQTMRPEEFTLRAILTGILIGALLTPCNIYSGLKIGWSFNMSISAALISFGFWAMMHKWGAARPWGILENNINQTTASSAASIVSSGFAAPIPAVTLITGREMGFTILAVWTLCVSLLGVVVAIGLRRQMLEKENLTFPSGVATARTVTEIYRKGKEGMARVKALAFSGFAAITYKSIDEFLIAIPKVTFLKGKVSQLGFVLDASPLMLGFGAIIGIRAGLSLFLGAIIAWGILAPIVMANQWVVVTADSQFLFGPLVEWLLWPGVTLMVVSSLASFVITWMRLKGGSHVEEEVVAVTEPNDVISRKYYIALVVTICALLAVVQSVFFGIALWAGLLAVLLSFILAIVSARVSGETGITPIGAMGKVTQFAFGFLVPGNPTANLMTANVTGGASDQCADLLHDLKTGQMIGATAKHQFVAQCFGVSIGAIVGTAAYLTLIHDPQSMLITAEWPAPAVATWKAVAETLRDGFGALPAGAKEAMWIAIPIGILLALLSRHPNARISKWMPSASSIGLAFVIPAWNSISMAFGALVAYGITKRFPNWSARFLIPIAAGLVAGESITGIFSATLDMLFP